MQKFIVALGLVALGSGCAGVATMPLTSMLTPGAGSLEIHNQTDIKLQEANFNVIKTNVVGHCNGFALLGIITIVPARFQTAMNRLYSQAEMQVGKPQTLGNLIMEKSSTYLILFSIPRVSVRADVVEFVPPAATLIIPHPVPLPSPPSENKSSAALTQ